MIEPAILDFTGEQSGASGIIWNDHYYVDDEQISEAFGHALPPRLADLVDIATYCYVADRLTRRPRDLRRDPYGLSWERRLHCKVPVRDLSFWQSSANEDELTSILGWLTDDRWSFEWVKSQRQPRLAETVGRLFGSVPDPDDVALFSCGLDSVAGAIRHLESSTGSLVLVNVGANSRMRGRLHSIVQLLNPQTSRVHAISVPLKLRDVTDPNRHEATQRTRGLVFLIFGAVAAAAAGRSELTVWENGIGAINLPYSEAQEGAKSTRAVHPRTIAAASRLLSRALGSFSIRCPAIFHTKADQCKGLSESASRLLNLSVSCDTGFVHRASKRPLCGFCTSCLLRRQGLWAAGLSDVDLGDEYRFDALSRNRTHDDPRGYGLDAMLAQAAAMSQALQSPNKWGAIVERFPSVLDAVDGLVSMGYGSEEARSRLMKLIETYVSEWATFPSERVGLFLSGVGRQRASMVPKEVPS